MYIDKFHFSPFKIDNNSVSICNDEWIIRDGKIFGKNKQISAEEFYDAFIKYGENRWFTEDFMRAYKNRKAGIPSSIAYFAIYCDFKCTFFPNVKRR